MVKSKFICLLLALALTLTGCGLKSPEEMYALPKTTQEYQSLQTQLDELLGAGYEYAAPVSGDNTQSVQLIDLDGDGEDEAVAYLRDTSGHERPLKICVFRSDGDRGYVPGVTIEGDGDAINSVVYCQLNDKLDSSGNSPLEIVVGWRISSTVYALSAYSMENDNVTQLMSAPSYTRYAVWDLDQDNKSEIVFLQLNAAQEGGNTASYYDWSEDTMMFVNTVPLSASLSSLSSIQRSYLTDGYPALYVNSVSRDNSGLIITDILSVTDGLLGNVTMDLNVGDSPTSHLTQTSLQDLSNDNVLEIPLPQTLRSADGKSYNLIHWVQYSSGGSAQSTGYTYHNTADGWYLKLADEWVGHLLISASETNRGATVERAITFYYQENLTDTPQPFLVIYKNTGTNRESRANMGERFLLVSESEATYAAELIPGGEGWNSGLESKDVYERFRLIVTEWSAD